METADSGQAQQQQEEGGGNGEAPRAAVAAAAGGGASSGGDGKEQRTSIGTVPNGSTPRGPHSDGAEQAAAGRGAAEAGSGGAGGDDPPDPFAHVDLPRALCLLLDVARGMAYLHARNVVHADLKSEGGRGRASYSHSSVRQPCLLPSWLNPFPIAPTHRPERAADDGPRLALRHLGQDLGLWCAPAPIPLRCAPLLPRASLAHTGCCQAAASSPPHTAPPPQASPRRWRSTRRT